MPDPARVGQSDRTGFEAVQALKEKACAVGATAFHLNTGERWIVVTARPGGRLQIERASDGERRWVWADYWLSESWADR